MKQIFYKKKGFLLLLTALAGGLIWWIFNNRILHIRQKEERETAIQKKMANLELQALRAQLNPHFIFNSLGGIEYFILSNQATIARDYLTKFGKLLRLFLESSRNRYITLADEVQLLQLYIDLEKMRYTNKFSDAIEVDPAINLEDTSIPSILIQPFVENAIKHGLFHKETAGNLFISFKLKDNFIKCEIVDDGVGRKAANEIKEKSLQSQKSRGIEIIEDRLDVIKNVDEFEVDFNITDLIDKNGNPCGTKVELLIPYEE